MDAGLETLDYAFAADHASARAPDPAPPFEPVLVGVVGSGNLEVLLEPGDAAGCTVRVVTSARGFGDIWRAVLADFHARHGLRGVKVSVNDMGATPAVVSLRLDQAVAEMAGARP